jgi:hypothetical protein
VNNDVRDVAFAPSGDRWFGISAGVVRDNRTDFTDFTVLDEGDGLPANTVRQLAIDSAPGGPAQRRCRRPAPQGRRPRHALGRVSLRRVVSFSDLTPGASRRPLSLKGEGVQGSQGQWISRYSKSDSVVMLTSRVSASSEM